MKNNSPSKLWKQIGSQPAQNSPPTSKSKSEAEFSNFSKKQNTQQIINAKGDKSRGDFSFSHLDISEIRLEGDHEQGELITKNVGWSKEANLQNILYQFSLKNQQNTNQSPSIEIKALDQKQSKHLKIFKMFGGILKNLKQQMLFFKKLLTKQQQIQKMHHIQLLGEFEKITKGLQLQLKQKNQQINTKNNRIVQLQVILAQKFKNRQQSQEQLMFENRFLNEKIKKENLQYEQQLAKINQQMAKAKQQNSDFKFQITVFKHKIASLQFQLAKKESAVESIGKKSIDLEDKKDEFLNKSQLKYLQGGRRIPYSPRTSKACKLNDSHRNTNSQIYPQHKFSLDETQANQIPEQQSHLLRIQSQKQSLQSPATRYRTYLAVMPSKTKSIHVVGQKLQKMKAQIHDEIKNLKNSVSTNI